MRQADIPAVERALDGLLSAILAAEERERAARTKPIEIRVWNAAEIMDGPILSRAEIAILTMADNPIGGACRHGIRQCGERLWSITGSIDAMGDVLERVADLDPPRFGARAVIMDRCWDGVGGAWWS